jgi:purine-binding chemotaxis protein CheW
MDTVQTLDADTTMAVGSETRQYLTFLLGDTEYGVDILRVQEIKDLDTITPLPNTPEYIRGVMNLRGTIVPIINLRQRFGLESVVYGPTTVVVVLNVIHDHGSRIMGIVVDAVSDLYNIADAEMRPLPDCMGTISIEFVKGLATVSGKIVIVVDIGQLLNARELAMVGNPARACQSVIESQNKA